jgi:hypothetical protein
MPHKDLDKRKAYHKEYNRKYAIENRERLREQKRLWKSANPDHKRKDPEASKRYRASDRIGARIRRGTWPRPSVFLCTDCDKHAEEYHHPNYDYPLWVEPLCKECHLKIHGKLSSDQEISH